MPSSGMLRRVALNVVPSSPILVTLMTEAFLGKSVLTRATQHNIPEGGIFIRGLGWPQIASGVDGKEGVVLCYQVLNAATIGCSTVCVPVCGRHT
jgi:hypothetical protein